MDKSSEVSVWSHLNGNSYPISFLLKKKVFSILVLIFIHFSVGAGVVTSGGGSIIYDFYRHVYDYIWDLYPQRQQNNSENKSSMY